MVGLALEHVVTVERPGGVTDADVELCRAVVTCMGLGEHRFTVRCIGPVAHRYQTTPSPSRFSAIGQAPPHASGIALSRHPTTHNHYTHTASGWGISLIGVNLSD